MHTSRLLLLAAMVLAGGCGKALTLQPPLDASSGASPVTGEVAAPQPFTAQLKFVGTIATLDRRYEPRLRPNQAFVVGAQTDPAAPLDTVPAYAALTQIQWRPVTGPHGAADEAHDVAANAARKAYDGDPVFAPGTHQLTLEAPAHAGGGEVTVRFFVGFIPATWWAGPDPDAWPASSDGDGRAVDVVDWATFTTSPAWPPDGRSYFGPESLSTIPSKRRPVQADLNRRTFYEIYGDRIYARHEGDTVHQDAWVVVVNGGYDKDSPYAPKVDPTDPGLPPDFAVNPSRYPVLQSLGLVGSPIGFRNQLTTKLANGTILRAPQSQLYPSFEPLSVFRNPVVAGYVRASFPGQAYLVVRSQDSHEFLDAPIADPIGLVALVDGGGGSPADRIARRRVLTFHVEPASVGEMALQTAP